MAGLVGTVSKQFHPRLGTLGKALDTLLKRSVAANCDEEQFISNFTAASTQKLALPADGRARSRRFHCSGDSELEPANKRAFALAGNLLSTCADPHPRGATEGPLLLRGGRSGSAAPRGRGVAAALGAAEAVDPAGAPSPAVQDEPAEVQLCSVVVRDKWVVIAYTEKCSGNLLAWLLETEG